MSHDEKYMKLMDSYKSLRRDPNKIEQSQKLLLAAMELVRKGNVSSEVIVASQYL
jgi:hypothetical protein